MAKVISDPGVISTVPSTPAVAVGRDATCLLVDVACNGPDSTCIALDFACGAKKVSDTPATLTPVKYL